MEDAVEHGALEEGDHAGPDARPRCRCRRRASPATSSQPKPSRRSITRTRRVTSVGMGAGHDHGPLVGLGQDAGDVEHVVGFEAEVELLDDRLGEQLDQGRRVGQRRDRDAADEGRGDPAHGGQIPPDQVWRHGRPLHLDHDLLAGAQAWRRGPGRSTPPRAGSRSNEEKTSVERPAEVGLDDRPDGLERLGRDPVAEQLELADQLLGEDALAGGEDLAELDVGGTEPLEGLAQPPGQPEPGDARVRPAAGPGAARSGTRTRGRGRGGLPPMSTRRPGGSRRRRSRSGTSADVAARSSAIPCRHDSWSRWICQGGWSLNAPMSRSSGADSGDTGRRYRAMSP